MEEHDVIVIGAGPAGYAAAIRVSQLGAKATIIEKEAVGGTCLNRGCIPTRVLARGAEFLDLASHAKDYGVSFGQGPLDFKKLVAREDVVVKTLVAGVKMLLKENGVEMVEGSAKLSENGEVLVAAPGGETNPMRARSVIIATGAQCDSPSVPGGQMVLDTTALLQLKELPRSIAVLGAGCIGISLAAVFSKLGSAVTVLEESACMLRGIDKEIVSQYEKDSRKNKIQYHRDCIVQAIERVSDDGVRIRAETKGQELVIEAQYVVNAEGREANIKSLGLEDLGVQLSGKKGVLVDDTMRTNRPGVFAAGDVTLEHMWTDVAYMEGLVAAENAVGGHSSMNYKAIPYWTSTTPGLAGVGLTEEEAIAKGHDVKIARFFFSGSGMAAVLGQRTGMLKLVTGKKYGEILGCHIVGAQAPDLIPEACLAIKEELTIEDIGEVFHVHPSLSESFWEAARSVNGSAIHLISRG